MGNAEVKGFLDGQGLVDDDALESLHRTFCACRQDLFAVDRSAFALLFRNVPFTVVDQVYDGLLQDAERREAAVLYSDIAAPLMLASTCAAFEKARMFFDVYADDPARRVAPRPDDVATAATMGLMNAVAPSRGLEDESGRVSYPAFRCWGCREVPTNLVFQCTECPGTGSVLGVPAAVVLCKRCAGIWEGAGIMGGTHTREHKLRKLRMVPNPKGVAFPGAECSACGQTPIVGPRMRCLDCTVHTQLCDDCYASRATPATHLSSHIVDPETERLSRADDVARTLYELGLPLPTLASSYKTPWISRKRGEMQTRTAKLTVRFATNVDEDEYRAIQCGEARNPPATVRPGSFAVPLTASDAATSSAFEAWALASDRIMPLLAARDDVDDNDQD